MIEIPIWVFAVLVVLSLLAVASIFSLLGISIYIGSHRYKKGLNAL